MIKFIYCVKRRPDLTSSEFNKYWLENHGPLVKANAQAIRAKRYVQSHLIDTPLNAVTAQARGTTLNFDGLTEIWWDSVDEAIQASQSSEGQAANLLLARDEANFCDLKHSCVFFSKEIQIF